MNNRRIVNVYNEFSVNKHLIPQSEFFFINYVFANVSRISYNVLIIIVFRLIMFYQANQKDCLQNLICNISFLILLYPLCILDL